MESETASAWIGGLAGLVTGAIAAIVAPWAKWGVEQKRIKLNRKVALIEKWRQILSQEDFERSNLLDDPSFGPLFELLSKDARMQIQRPTNHLVLSVDSASSCPDRDLLMKEVARIEKEWDLL